MGKTITIAESEFDKIKDYIGQLEKALKRQGTSMPDEIVAFEYLVGTGIKRDWKFGDEGYGRNSPKWWRELPEGHNLEMIRQAKYRRVE